MKFTSTTIFFACATATANAHGTLKQPMGPKDMTDLAGSPAWDGSAWFSQGSEIGCAAATGENCGLSGAPCCEEHMQPTLTDPDQLTHQLFPKTASSLYLRGTEKNVSTNPLLSKNPLLTTFQFNPWLAPGHAPVANSCGILGGWQYDESSRDYVAGPGDGYSNFKDGKGGPTNAHMPDPNMAVPAGTGGDVVLQADINRRIQEAQGKKYATNDNPVWKAGSQQKVSYSIFANHGGGFQYRICPIDYLRNGNLDEGCFVALEFVGETSWFEYYDLSNETDVSIPFTSVRVNDANTNGVLPKGSTWTQIGLPSCQDETSKICESPDFENEVSKQGIYGWIMGNPSSLSPALAEIVQSGGFEIADKIQVPEGLSGDYVFSWRWDSEQTPQVWTQCSIVTIEE